MEPTITQVDGQPAEPAKDQNAQANVAEGVQKRIDELTAEKYAAQREIDAFRQREQVYIQELAGRSRQPDPAPAQPQVEVAPELKEQMDAYFGARLQQIDNYMRQLQAQSAVMQVRTGAAQLGLPEAVARKAEEVSLYYARQGQPIDPDMAYTIAAGALQREQWTKEAQARQSKQSFNQPNPLMTMQSIAAPVTPPAQRPQTDWDSLPLDQRMAKMEAEMGDIPLF